MDVSNYETVLGKSSLVVGVVGLYQRLLLCLNIYKGGPLLNDTICHACVNVLLTNHLVLDLSSPGTDLFKILFFFGFKYFDLCMSTFI